MGLNLKNIISCQPHPRRKKTRAKFYKGGMFKAERKKRKSKDMFISDFKEVSENSNFRNGSISMSIENQFEISLNKLNELTFLPIPNQQIRIVTRKAINSFDFILSILHKVKIEKLIIAFYRIGKKVINELHELQKQDKIGKIVFLINDSFPKLVPDAWNLLKSFESSVWIVKVENNHTKIILIKTDENYYVIEGSGNLSVNARIEQYLFENNKKSFLFHQNWIEKI
jgi:hypothetical protein